MKYEVINNGATILRTNSEEKARQLVENRNKNEKHPRCYMQEVVNESSDNYNELILSIARVIYDTYSNKKIDINLKEYTEIKNHLKSIERILEAKS